MRSTIIYTIFFLLTISSVKAHFDASDAIMHGFVHGAISDVVYKPIKNSLNPSIVPYYVCTDTGSVIFGQVEKSLEKCYTDVIDYTIIVPPNPIVIFLTNLLIVWFWLATVVWCFTSTIEEKIEWYHIYAVILLGKLFTKYYMVMMMINSTIQYWEYQQFYVSYNRKRSKN